LVIMSREVYSIKSRDSVGGESEKSTVDMDLIQVNIVIGKVSRVFPFTGVRKDCTLGHRALSKLSLVAFNVSTMPWDETWFAHTITSHMAVASKLDPGPPWSTLRQ